MIKSFFDYLKYDIGWLPLLFAAIVSCKTLGFHFFPADTASYGVFIIVTCMVLRHKMELNPLCVLFLFYIPVALFLADPAPVFKSWLRYGLFALVYIAVSPLVVNEYAQELRMRLFKGVLICCIAISAISFICYFLGINMMRNTYTGAVMLDYQTNTAGTFGGITSQSMLLGPISGVAAIVCTYLAMNRNKIFWVLVVMCGGSVLFAASRSSLIATLIGEIVLFYFSTENIGRNMKRIILAILFLLVSNPLWNGALEGIMAKNKGSIYEGINTDSRTSKWNMRIEEWKDSPLYGIGFCTVSDRDNIGLNGMIEPGSSWLAVLSMTGTVGFLLFGFIFYKAARNALDFRTPEGALSGGILMMLGAHMLAEGYVFSGGSFLCFLVWLSIGCASDYTCISDDISDDEP
ncbi:MAG: O-antigen ligase family protein [Coprobacter sp.]|nr:O-antigen ligase family protein [Coprobacter sp.]